MKVINLSEVTRGGKMLAHVTVEIPLDELPDILENLDLSEVDECHLESKLDAAHALRKIRKVEAPADKQEA